VRFVDVPQKYSLWTQTTTNLFSQSTQSMDYGDESKHRAIIEKVKAVGLDDVAKWLEGMAMFDSNVRPLHHRRMSNNSVAFTEQPSRELLNLVFTMMQAEGEPGFINLEEARRRRPNAEGLNPCAEILLDSYGVCNLTTVNMVEFVKEIDGRALY
jgi:ribonucleoside-triphosphate reductase